MRNRFSDKRSYNSKKLIVFFLLELIAVVLLGTILIYFVPKWLLVIICITLLIKPYERFIMKLDEARIKGDRNGVM